jgi:hypothetical protein
MKTGLQMLVQKIDQLGTMEIVVMVAMIAMVSIILVKLLPAKEHDIFSYLDEDDKW